MLLQSFFCFELKHVLYLLSGLHSKKKRKRTRVEDSAKLQQEQKQQKSNMLCVSTIKKEKQN